jgi:hypothetical protein
MKKITLGVFTSREAAEKAIVHLQNENHIDASDISYIYRNTNDELKEVAVDSIEKKDEGTKMAEGAAGGAVTGAVVGTIAGLATVAGVIPVIGAIFVAGPLLAALGIGAGAVGAAAATGVIAGGLIGALTNLGLSENVAKEYQDRVFAGDILVAVHAEDSETVKETLLAKGAVSIEAYTPSI